MEKSSLAFKRLFDCCYYLTDGLLPNGSVSVLNACRLKTTDGKLDTIEGYAYRPDKNEPGKLKVVFDGSGSGADCKLATHHTISFV